MENQKSIKLFVEMLDTAHEVLNGTFTGTSSEAMHAEANKALPIGASFGHAVFSEDNFVSMQMGIAPLFMGEFKEKTGFSAPMPAPGENWESAHLNWAKSVKVDEKLAMEYAKAVQAKTRAWLIGMNDEDLYKEVDFSSWGMGMKPMSWAIGMVIIGHAHNLAGEISALKGVNGLKGYPF